MERMSAKELAQALVEPLLAERPESADGRAGVFLNGLGATKYEELFVVWKDIAPALEAAGVRVVLPEAGERGCGRRPPTRRRSAAVRSPACPPSRSGRGPGPRMPAGRRRRSPQAPSRCGGATPGGGADWRLRAPLRAAAQMRARRNVRCLGAPKPLRAERVKCDLEHLLASALPAAVAADGIRIGHGVIPKLS